MLVMQPTIYVDTCTCKSLFVEQCKLVPVIGGSSKHALTKEADAMYSCRCAERKDVFIFLNRMQISCL